MKICFVTSEVAPYSKSGGLGDVGRALSEALASRGHDVVVVSPAYRGVLPITAPTSSRLTVPAGGQDHVLEVRTLTASTSSVRHRFLAHAVYDRDGLYGDDRGAFGDNHFRFALLCRGALELAHRELGWSDDAFVFHVHDWQTALLPLLLDAAYRPVGRFERAASVLTLHNPAHQGRLPPELFVDLELPARWFSPMGLEFYGDLGLLKGGLLHADQITTVSPTFATEIVEPGGGFGLEDVLAGRAEDLTGILNGIDEDEWNPAADAFLPAPFTAADLSGKARCKAELQVELGLPVDPDAPLVGSVGRLDPQKGVELLLDSVPWLVEQGAQLVVLGSAAAAHRRYEEAWKAMERRFPTHVRAWVGFSEAVAHRIEAGSDLFVMPSLFEPCGLNQFYSQRYGTPPIVRRTGGLADSVQEGPEGTGFVFSAPHAKALRDAMYRAIALFRDDPEGMDALRRRCMALDRSWGPAITAYEDVYARALAQRGGG